MNATGIRLLGLFTLVTGLIVFTASEASACQFRGGCTSTGLEDGAATVEFDGSAAAGLVAGDTEAAVDYAWRLRTPCMLADEAEGTCSPLDIRPCTQQPDRVIGYFVVQQRPVVRPDGTALVPVPAGFQPGDLLGSWTTVRQGCLDITALNPPPSPARCSATSSDFRSPG
jgi:hypothetical protein